MHTLDYILHCQYTTTHTTTLCPNFLCSYNDVSQTLVTHIYGLLCTEAEFLFLITHNFKAVIATGLKPGMVKFWRFAQSGPFSQILSHIHYSTEISVPW